MDISDLGDEANCYVTTIGRVTGNPHEIEIWFAMRNSTIYMLSGGRERSDWVKNVLATPEVRVRIRDREFGGRARSVDEADEDAWARDAAVAKYQESYGGDLSNWKRNSLVMAVDLEY